jgi:hypothetical protein
MLLNPDPYLPNKPQADAKAARKVLAVVADQQVRVPVPAVVARQMAVD